MDRGYYSEKLMETLHNKNINYIFRIKKSHVFLSNQKDFVTEIGKNKFIKSAKISYKKGLSASDVILLDRQA